ncbi:MAG: hypothetical protein AB8B53_13555 [Flavobacteriales bacterium]
MKLIKSIAGVIMILVGAFLGFVSLLVLIRNVSNKLKETSELTYLSSFIVGSFLAFLLFGSVSYILIKYGIKFLKSKSPDNDTTLDSEL